MARMLGRQVWYGVFCSCCNGPRTVRVERHRENRQWRAELRPEGELPTPLDDPFARCWPWSTPAEEEFVLFAGEALELAEVAFPAARETMLPPFGSWSDWDCPEDAAYDHL